MGTLSLVSTFKNPDVGQPIALAGCGENAVDSGEHALQAFGFALEMLEPGVGQAIDAGRTAFRGHSRFRFEPALAQHALQSGVERAFFHLQHFVGDLFDVLDERVSVHGLEAERFQNHDFEGAGKEITMFGVSSHGGIIA